MFIQSDTYFPVKFINFTYLFVGSPKIGKSFFMAQLAYHVSTGTPLWDYHVKKGTVLYLALEDDYRRLQERMYRMFGTESTENLYFSVSSKYLGKGLTEQLTGFIKEHPDTTLVIIDTLQKIREADGDSSYSYAKDYEIINQLKQFSDSQGNENFIRFVELYVCVNRDSHNTYF